MIKNYFIIAIRNILKHKTISLINVFGLTVSMSVCLLLLLIIMDQFSYDDFHTKGDRIYRVITERTQNGGNLWETASVPYPLAAKMTDITDIEMLTKMKNAFNGVAATENSEIPFKGYFTDENFLKIFDYPLKYGTVEKALTLPNSIVLSNELAQKLFGDELPLDKIINVGDKGEFIVTAVLDEWPGKSHFDFDALASVQLLPALEEKKVLSPSVESWQNIYDNYIYFLLRPDKDLQSVERVLAKGNEYYDTQNGFSYKFVNQALNDITPGRELSNMPGFSLPGYIIYFLAALAFIVLLSATFNYANLSAARALNRAKEIGVRKVIGAKRRHIIIQFIVEAIIISLISFMLADIMREFIQDWLNDFFHTVDAPFSFEETPNLIFIFIGFALLAGLIAGAVPAIFFSATNPLKALKKNVDLKGLNGSSWGKLNFRKVLMVVQFAFSIFFIITVVTIYRQSKYILEKDYGYRTNGLITIPLNGLKGDNLKNEIASFSKVQNAGFVSHMPALGSNSTFELKKSIEGDKYLFSWFSVDKSYLDNLDLTLLQGRNFDENKGTTERTTIINETAVKKLGYEFPQDAIGENLLFSWPDPEKNDTSRVTQYVEIIGVVADHNFQRLDQEIQPMALRMRPERYRHLVIKADPENIPSVLASINGIWPKHTKRPFEYQLYSDEFWKSNGLFDLLATILGYIAFITVSIASLGLLGMVIFFVQNRIKEIGVRKVLGAGWNSIMLLVTKRFATLIIISFIIGGPLAYFMNNAWLETYPYRISFGVETILFGLLAIILLVTITIGPQVLRATKVNPAESLRNE